MSNSAGPSLDEFAGAVALIRIGYKKLFAHRTENANLIETKDPAFSLGFEVGVDNSKSILVQLGVRLSMHDGEFECIVEGEFHLQGQFDVVDATDEVISAFINDVALMSLFPYLRQAISDLTYKTLESAITLPLLRRGDLQIIVKRD